MKDFFDKRILGIRPSILAILLVGLVLLAVAILPDSSSRQGWLLQVPKDTGYVLMGLVYLYGAHLAFSHLRIHKVKKNPDDYDWKHIALVCSMVLSCALIISAVLG